MYFKNEHEYLHIKTLWQHILSLIGLNFCVLAVVFSIFWAISQSINSLSSVDKPIVITKDVRSEIYSISLDKSYIGFSPWLIGDEETGLEFKQRFETLFEELFGEKPINAKWIEETVES
jgi:hypothetical protein